MRPWEKSASRDQWRSASRASADPRQQAGALESARVHGHRSFSDRRLRDLLQIAQCILHVVLRMSHLQSSASDPQPGSADEFSSYLYFTSVTLPLSSQKTFAYCELPPKAKQST